MWLKRRINQSERQFTKNSRQNSKTTNFKRKKIKKWFFQTQLFPINENELGPCYVQGWDQHQPPI